MMENYEYLNSQNQYGQNPQRAALKRLIAALVILTAVGIVIYVIVSALITRAQTGTLHVTTDNGASISVNQPDGSPKVIGTSDSTVRLAPASYQITVSKDTAKATTTISIKKGQRTDISLKPIAPLEVSQVATVAGQNIYPTAAKLYFLDVAQQRPSTYRFGATIPLPFLGSVVNDTTQIHWLDATRYYSRNTSGVWTYVDGKTVTRLERGFVTKRGSESFNKTGQAAFVADNNLYIVASPNANRQKLAGVNASSSQTSISPSGSRIIVSGEAQSNLKPITSTLYENGTSSALPDNLAGAQNISWSPDSNHISYTTLNGAYMYDLTSKQTSQILSGSPTNPLSFTWLNNQTVIYGQQQTIWSRGIGETVSRKLTDISGVLNAAEPFTVAADGHTVYFGTGVGQNNKGGGIYQFIPDYASLPADQQQTLLAAQRRHDRSNIPSVSGATPLVEQGVSDDQVNVLNYALYLYSAQKPFKQATISNVNVEPHDSRKLTDAANFNVSLDGNAYTGRLEYISLFQARLILSSNGTQLYDSGFIDLTNQNQQ